MKPKKRSQVCASGIPVFCAFTKISAAAVLKPHPKNPKKHPAKQLDRYELVVAGTAKKKGNGWRRAIVVSARSGFITKGHGAWQMANRRGWDVPIEIQSYKSEAEEIRDLLADNRLAELAETDDEKLAALLANLDADDLCLTGFDASELEKLTRDTSVEEGEFPITAKLGERYDYVLIYTTNETEFVFLQSLLGVRQERSYKKTGIGLGRAISLERALKSLRENYHSIDVQGGDHDDASASARRGRVRAKKSAR
ncbi:MAG TPA: hypothetical protein VHW03_09985 [Chthoniobacterales bacterium]|jgi:hypothetical protein|nr:hypothetical protein [Chthoniobacterales bacterium]